jgi:hypothetical protein
MQFNRPSKGYYSESEAARVLGLNVEDFRRLVRRHILETDDELGNLPMTSYQPSDLLLLHHLLSTRRREPVTAPAAG